MSDWQPISTAPKDGPILVFGRWEGAGDLEDEPRIGVAEHILDCDYTWFCTNSATECRATHWQPLPEPPKETT